MASFQFNAAEVQPSETFDVIPAAKYLGQVIQSDLRPTKNGTGQYIWLEQEIIDGEYKGRKLWTTLNIINSNEKAVEIAARQLSALCHAVGEIAVSDTDQLHFKPMIMVVKVKPADGQYAAKNEVSGYEIASGSAITGTPKAATPAARPATPTAAPAAAVKTAPWARRAAA